MLYLKSHCKVHCYFTTKSKCCCPLDLDFINLPNPIKLPPGDDVTSGAISIGGAGFPTFNSGAQTLVYVSLINVL